jgi:hypothetical protein
MFNMGVSAALRMTRLLAVAVSAALVASATVAAGLAGDGGRAKVRLTARDQAVARAVLIRRSDLRPSAGWTGGRIRPDLTPPTCPNYHPKQSDLVVTGAAAVTWRMSGPTFRQFGSEATVLRTRRMVRLDWQRSTSRPAALLSCLRQTLVKAFGSSARLISLETLDVPPIAPCALAFHAMLVVRGQRGVFEDIGLCRGRTEIEVTAFGLTRDEQSLSAAALRLARLLVRRARAG